MLGASIPCLSVRMLRYFPCSGQLYGNIIMKGLLVVLIVLGINGFHVQPARANEPDAITQSAAEITKSADVASVRTTRGLQLLAEVSNCCWCFGCSGRFVVLISARETIHSAIQVVNRYRRGQTKTEGE